MSEYQYYEFLALDPPDAGGDGDAARHILSRGEIARLRRHPAFAIADFARRRNPASNGKAERFVQTLLREWAYGHAYANSAQRQAQLARWLNYYNRHRPHGHRLSTTNQQAACEQPA